MPEQGRHKRTYQELAPRVALETLVRVAAVQEGIPIEVLARPRAGELASHVNAEPRADGGGATGRRAATSLRSPRSPATRTVKRGPAPRRARRQAHVPLP